MAPPNSKVFQQSSASESRPFRRNWHGQPEDRNGSPVRISVVVPCFNEQAVLAHTYQRLVKVLSGIDHSQFEMLFVDDGSSDGTNAELRSIQTGDPNVRVISLSRNFGHQFAVTAGIDHANGDVVVLIDADLQDPPELIPEMLDRWRNGADVVYGRRTEREGETTFKLGAATAFYRLINYLSDIPIPLYTGDFRLMDRSVVDALRSMPERDRFVRGMVAWVGFTQEPLSYRRAPRFAGTTKYPFASMVKFAVDGIFSFSLVPLRLATYLGFVASALSILGILYALVLRLATDIWVPGWTLLFVAALFLGGVQLIAVGVVGEYVGRIYGEVKRRPLYVVSERLGFSSRPVEQGNDKSRHV